MLALVTDSTCGLTRTEAAELGVTVVPMTYIVDSNRRVEGFVGENGNYDADYRSCIFSMTEAVRASAFEEVFRAKLDAGYDVLCITMSSRLSGTYRSAEEAAASVNKGRAEDGPKAVAFDSWHTAGSLEYLVRYARERADSSEAASVDELVGDLVRRRSAQEIVFSVPDMQTLRRSGRLGAFRRAAVTNLNRYPVMYLKEGAIEEARMARGAHGMGVAMVRLAPADANDFVISHFGVRGVEAQQLFYEVHRCYPHAKIRVKDGGPVLAKHLGLGSVGLSWEPVGR